MTTMKAMRYDRYGGPEVLEYANRDKPEAGAGQVLIRIRAASVNPIDWKLRSGAMKTIIPLELPTGAGQDVAGEIAAIGDGVDDLKVGDRVFAMMGVTPAGAYAEYIVLDRTAVARKPDTLDFVSAAAVPMGALTAWQAIVDLGGLKAGSRLFVHAAAGNVGGWAVRIGHALGAHVTAAASAKDRDDVMALGADAFVDYQAGPFEQAAGDMDMVLDPLAGDIQARSWGMIKPGGILVSTLMVGEPEEAKARGVRAAMVQGHPDGGELALIAKMIDDGKLVPRIGRVMSLDEAGEAQRLGEAGEVKGKIVLEMA
jgi:NADPH:quinone reductase-like Zn-dependent oxidoreductase